VIRHRGGSEGSDNTDPSVGAIKREDDIAVREGDGLRVVEAARPGGDGCDHGAWCVVERKGDVGCDSDFILRAPDCGYASERHHDIGARARARARAPTPISDVDITLDLS